MAYRDGIKSSSKFTILYLEEVGGSFGNINVLDSIFTVNSLNLILNTKESELTHPLVASMILVEEYRILVKFRTR